MWGQPSRVSVYPSHCADAQPLNPSQIREGSRLRYNDGRPGHTDALCTVLGVDSSGVTVQFEDRADVTLIKFDEAAWMEFLSLI
jgi:hypothetical protein